MHLADGYYRACGRPMLFLPLSARGGQHRYGRGHGLRRFQALLLLTGSPHLHARAYRAPGDRARPVGVLPPGDGADHEADLATLPASSSSRLSCSGPGARWLPAAWDRCTLTCRWTSRPTRRTWRYRGHPSTCRPVVPARTSLPRSVPARRLMTAQRPVIVAGGVILAEVAAELVALAEYLGAPVVTTWMQGAIPEDHDLNGWSVGDTASTSGNALAAPTPTSSSPLAAVSPTGRPAPSAREVSFAIPPTALIQLDVEARDRQELSRRDRAGGRRQGRAGRPPHRRADDLPATTAPGRTSSASSP